jgi:hypothetical protein
MKKKLTAKFVKDTLDSAMGLNWGSEVDEVLERLHDRFPTWTKTIKKLEGWAGDASNERAEPHHGEEYYDDLWWRVMRTVNRMFASEK